MRKAGVLVLSCLFLYSLSGQMSMIKVLMLIGGLISACLISRVPSKFVRAAKYPLIGLSLALPPALFLYPSFRVYRAVAGLAVFLAFYGLALFLVSLEEKGKQVYKEAAGLSLLYAASCINLFFTGHLELITPLSITVLLFLFIINKVRLMPFIAVYTVVAVGFSYFRGIGMFANGVAIDGVERYLLLGCGFALLLLTFVAYLQKPDFSTVLAFFCLLYVSVDLLMSVGLSFKSGLLYQPSLALFIVGPVIGIMLKGEKERK
jgi:hypothetical protein